MKTTIKNTIYIVLLFTGAILFSQEEGKDSIPLTERYIVFKGDTLLIALEEVHLLKKLRFKSSYERRYYYWFQKKTIKAYPYATMAADRLEVLNKRLTAIKSKRKRKKYTKRVQKYMEAELTEQLKKLTRTEGRILIKLIYRQTGETTFNLVKNLRNGWKAFWYNVTANMFKLSLKAVYDPINSKEDALIEDVLQRAFVNGTLKKQTPAIEIDYLNLNTNQLIPLPKPSKKQ